MELPKHVVVCGKKFRIKTKKRSNGGSFDVENLTITIGVASPGRVQGIFIHEILELICEERDVRYYLFKDRNDNEGLKFVFNHKEFDIISQDLAAVLQNIDFKKLEADDDDAEKKDSAAKMQVNSAIRKENN